MFAYHISSSICTTTETSGDLRFSIHLHKYYSYMLCYRILLEWFVRFNAFGGKDGKSLQS